jgi:hypothetical protein
MRLLCHDKKCQCSKSRISVRCRQSKTYQITAPVISICNSLTELIRNHVRIYILYIRKLYHTNSVDSYSWSRFTHLPMIHQAIFSPPGTKLCIQFADESVRACWGVVCLFTSAQSQIFVFRSVRFTFFNSSCSSISSGRDVSYGDLFG